MEFANSKLILRIIGYLTTADLAYFSLVSKSIRQYTHQQKVIDLSNIIYCYSKQEFVSILKILRFHHFSHWILAESALLNDSEIARIIANMMQSRFGSINGDSEKSLYVVRHITFKSSTSPYTNRSTPVYMSEKNEIIQCLSHLQLHHINIESINITMSIFKSSQKSLIS
eukprot:371337_1